MTREQAVIEAARALHEKIEWMAQTGWRWDFAEKPRNALRSALAALDAAPSGHRKWGVYSMDKRGFGSPQLEVVCPDHGTAIEARDNLRRQLPAHSIEAKEMAS